VHDTACSTPPWEPAGSGTFCTSQLVPFQASASGWASLVPVPYQPTAVQALADVQSTPNSGLILAGLAMTWMVQLVPFHRSARPCSFPCSGK
jgi:hypothetical protein